MALNLNTIVPASLKAKEVATVDYVDNSYTQLQTTLQSLATSEEARDGIINTFYQTSAPTSGMNFGDYWLDTDASGYPVYRYEGTNHLNSGTLTWKASTSNSATAIQKAYIAQTTASTAVTNAATAQTAANAAQTTANSKITTFYQTSAPTATTIGDLWVDTDNNNQLYRYNGSSWITIQDTTVANNIYTTNTTTIDGGKITTDSIWVGGNVNSSSYNWNSGTPNGFGLFSNGDTSSGEQYNIIGGKIYGANIKGAVFDVASAKMQSSTPGNTGSFIPSSAVSWSGYGTSVLDLQTDYFYSPAYGSGYNQNRLTTAKAEFIIDAALIGGANTVTIQYQLNGGSWISIENFIYKYNKKIALDVGVGYIKFRVYGGISSSTYYGASISVTSPAILVNRYTQVYATAGGYGFTIPATVTSITLTAIGGGGGGGGCTGSGDNHAGGGGGSGGISSVTISVTPGTSLSIAVGAYGAGASTYFNVPQYYNPENHNYYGLTGGTSSVSYNGNVVVSATGGSGGWYSNGDSCVGDAGNGAGGSPNGVRGGPINCNRNSYPRTPGGTLANYSYGQGGKSHGDGSWVPTNGTSGAVIISYEIKV